jgi:hypothetical protein
MIAESGRVGQMAPLHHEESDDGGTAFVDTKGMEIVALHSVLSVRPMYLAGRRCKRWLGAMDRIIA